MLRVIVLIFINVFFLCGLYGEISSEANAILKEIAAKYKKSAAQLCIRWCLQNNTLPLPKSITESRIKENSEVFDFNISDEDMKTINNIGYFAGSGLNPDKIDF